jgi:hypothetical protein
MRTLAIAMLATTILMAPITLAYGQQAVSKDKLVGTWKLLSFYDESVDNGKKANVFGENPRGLLILTADGRIALTFLDKSRQPAKGAIPTDLEAADLFKTMLAYVGRYELDPTATEQGTKMTIRSEVASNPRLEGVDRGFFVRVDGNKLIVRTNPPARSPLTGELSTRNVIFEREP